MHVEDSFANLPNMTIRRDGTLTRSTLMDRIWDAPLATVASGMGMTANGLAKLCDRLCIPRPDRRYWHLAPTERARLRPVLPPPPPDAGEIIEFGGPRHSRRSRTRLSMEERREQLLDAAAHIATLQGVGHVTHNRIARQVDISEAQAYNCFASRLDMLVALARRELVSMEQTRRGAISRGDDPLTSVVLSTIFYLQESETRGPLLHALLRVPEVERALREERAELRSQARAPVLASMQARYGMSDGEAQGANAILSSIVQRAGALLAAGRIDHNVATRLCLSIVLAGMRSNASTAKDHPETISRTAPARRSPQQSSDC